MRDIEVLIQYIRDSKQNVFIEVEAKPSKMQKFIDNHNDTYKRTVSKNDDGIIVLKEDANKWSVELRIYFTTRKEMPEEFRGKTTKNHHYRGNYKYRINRKDIAEALFSKGFHIGLNKMSS